MIYKVSRDNLISVLPSVQGMLQDVVDRGCGRFSFWDIASAVDAGEMDLFAVIADNKIIGCGVLKVEQYPQMRVALVLAAAGDNFALWRDEWIAVCRRWAQENNCTQVEMIGRVGWMRELRDVAKTAAAHMIMEV